MSELEHIVRFEQGYDCIRFECKWGVVSCVPGSGGSHGRSGLDIRFVVKGDEGAVQFLLATGWLPRHVSDDHMLRHNPGLGVISSVSYPSPADLGYHSKTPRYEGQGQMVTDCEWTGGTCYYDGSSLNADDAMSALVNGGDEALWAFLDAYYDHVFHGGPYPTPAEYPKPLRGADPHIEA